MYCFICTLLLLLFFVDVHSHKCNHNQINKNLEIIQSSNVKYANRHSISRRRRALSTIPIFDSITDTDFQSIRITPYWDYLEYELTFIENESQFSIAYIKQLISSAIRYFEKFVNVLPVSGNLYLPLKCLQSVTAHGIINCIRYDMQPKCDKVSIPESLFDEYWLYFNQNNSASFIESGVGVANTDFLLFVSAGNCSQDASTLAYASVCYQDQYGRPIAGHIRFCLNSSSASKNRLYWGYNILTAIHELTHTLIMEPDLWKHFHSIENRNEIIPESEVYEKHMSTVDHTNRTWIITPTVREMARLHYNCSSLIGLPLEDDGGMGSSGSHWEELHVNYEYMNAQILSSVNSVSIFTLALMYDSGWYEIDFEYAHKSYQWGWNEGCAFFDEQCIDSTTQISNFQRFYCNSSEGYDDGCGYQHFMPAICNLVSQSKANLNSFQSFFGDAQIGGRSEFSEYCPFRGPRFTTVENKIQSEINYESLSENICFDIRNKNINSFSDYNYYGKDSRCAIAIDTQSAVQFGICLKHKCFRSQILMYIINPDTTSVRMICDYDPYTNKVTDESAIQSINNRYTFNIKCPTNINDICYSSSHQFSCYFGHYSSVYDKCVCNAGYIGIYCNITDTDVYSIIDSSLSFGTHAYANMKSVPAPTRSPAEVCVNITGFSGTFAFFNTNPRIEWIFDGYYNYYGSYEYSSSSSSTSYYLWWNILYHEWRISREKGSNTLFAYCFASEFTFDISECNSIWYVWNSQQFVSKPDVRMQTCITPSPTLSPTSLPTVPTVPTAIRVQNTLQQIDGRVNNGGVNGLLSAITSSSILTPTISSNDTNANGTGNDSSSNEQNFILFKLSRQQLIQIAIFVGCFIAAVVLLIWGCIFCLKKKRRQPRKRIKRYDECKNNMQMTAMDVSDINRIIHKRKKKRVQHHRKIYLNPLTYDDTETHSRSYRI